MNPLHRNRHVDTLVFGAPAHIFSLPALSSLVLFLLVGVTGHAMPRGGPPIELIAKRAALSDTQVQQIKTLTINSRRKMIPLRAKIQVAQLDLRQALDSPNAPSEKRISDLIWRVGKLKIQAHKQRALMMLRIRKLMTPAQWKKTRLMRQQRRMRRREDRRTQRKEERAQRRQERRQRRERRRHDHW